MSVHRRVLSDKPPGLRVIIPGAEIAQARAGMTSSNLMAKQFVPAVLQQFSVVPPQFSSLSNLFWNIIPFMSILFIFPQPRNLQKTVSYQINSYFALTFQVFLMFTLIYIKHKMFA
jgi:hypothetical protein